VELAEQAMFGMWRLDHFLQVFVDNAAHVLG
jgi:hypothetical protein